MENLMVKEHSFGLMEKTMLENSRMDIEMVKEHTHGLLEISM